MNEIEVVIRIPEEWMEQFKAFKHPSTLETVILQGTVLPKGHGRLCDIDAALKCMDEVADDKSNIKECAMGFFDWACSKRVVLGADKEVSE